MTKARILLYVGGVVLATLAMADLRGDQTKEAAAVKAANAWLTIVDQGKYAKSWDEAGTFFKGAVARREWEKQVGAVRTPLGAVKKRQQAGAKYTKQLPGAPDGEYVVIRYQTSFEHKEAAVETVTPVLDKMDSGEWLATIFARSFVRVTGAARGGPRHAVAGGIHCRPELRVRSGYRALIT
jgi:hypothetical protein